MQSVHSDCSCHKRVDYKNVINIAKLLHLSAPHIHCRQKMLSRDFHQAFYGHVLNLAINNSVINWRPCHKSFLLHIKFENKWEWQSFCCGRVMFSFGRKSRCIFFLNMHTCIIKINLCRIFYKCFKIIFKQAMLFLRIFLFLAGVKHNLISRTLWTLFYWTINRTMKCFIL